jgi:hypothetical protein
MAARTTWAQENLVALVSDYAVNMLIYKALLVIFWNNASLLPWLLHALAYMHSLFEGASGKALNCASNNKVMASCAASWTLKPCIVVTAQVMQQRELSPLVAFPCQGNVANVEPDANAALSTLGNRRQACQCENCDVASSELL